MDYLAARPVTGERYTPVRAVERTGNTGKRVRGCQRRLPVDHSAEQRRAWMFILRKAVLATALAALAIGSAAAQTNGREVKLARALNATAATMAAQPPPTLTNPVAYISLRGGGMISPRGGALVGADVSLPTLSIGPGWHGRVSGDVIFKANFGGV